MLKNRGLDMAKQIVCPRCGSVKMVKAGIQRLAMGNKQRYLCKRCRKITIKPRRR